MQDSGGALGAAASYLRDNPTWHEEDGPAKAADLVAFCDEAGLKPRRVLDIGCGVGAVTAALARSWPGVELEGWDLAASPLQRARQLAPELSFFLGDALAEARPADLVLLVDVLEHQEDAHGFLRGAARLAPQVVIRVPLEASVRDLVFPGRMLAHRRRYGHRHSFCLAQVLALVEEAGLEVVRWRLHRVEPVGLAWPGRWTDRVRRWMVGSLSPRAVDWWGGYSVVVQARSPLAASSAPSNPKGSGIATAPGTQR